MLVTPDKASLNGTAAAVLNKTVSAILSSMRDTDISGWQTQDRVLGVIFTELGTQDTRLVVTALHARVTAALRSALVPELLSHLQLSFHSFPDTGDSLVVGRRTLASLYPDLTQLDRARRVSRVVKRAIDVAGSSIVVIVLSPLLLAIAAAIKLTSPGPVLFRQQRVGQYGGLFTFLKFRSMHASCDTQLHRAFVTQFIEGNMPASASGQNGKVVYKITKDPRVTRVGRILRRTSLDELPQLLNVLWGAMSLVGPRPPIPYELEKYDIWHRRRILEAKPGITGLWQVNGRSRLRFDDQVRLDLKYAQTWSIWLDLKILLRTPRAVLSGEGAH